MIKRNVSLPRVDRAGEDATSTADQIRRRSPTNTKKLQQAFASPKSVGDFRLSLSPPGSPRNRSRARSQSPTARNQRSAQGWNSAGRGAAGVGRSIGAFVEMVAGSTGTGVRGGVGGNGDPDAARKGPKSWLRYSGNSVVPPRKVLAAVCIALCVLAGGRRLVGFAGESKPSPERGGSASKPSLRGEGSRWGSRKPELLASGETSYCSAPLDYPVAVPPQAPAGDSQDHNLVLRQLQVTIRHGDRSAIHELPGAPEQRWRCQPYSDDVKKIWEGVDRFSIYDVDGRSLKRTLSPELLQDENLGKTFKGQTGLCKPGQLTEFGVRQHLTLGEHMRKAYSALLGGELNPNQIYVRSTDYTRTLQSAAAFLMSFFPGSWGISLITDENENGEVMHGVGLKTGGKDDESGGPEKVKMGACDRATELSKTQNGGFHPRADVARDLAGIFSGGIEKMRMTEVADVFHAMSCHNMTLPCTEKGCITETLALSVMSQADSQLCMRYQGAAGGLEAASLSLYPFTSEILGNMRDVLAGDDRKTFALFSGHDTVVAPLLAALGAYNCKWPPYASHVAFELWSKPSNSVDNGNRPRERTRRNLGAEASDERGSDGHGDGDFRGVRRLENDVVQGDRELESAVEDDAYIRLTFNGQPVTHRITDCRDLSETQGRYGREFCPLSAFAKTIGRAIGDYNTLDEACKAFHDENRHD